MSLIFQPLTEVRAASSWSPTLLVNTEAFEVIDDSNASSDVSLRFGAAINKSLIYERTAARFKFDDDLLVIGDTEITGTASGSQVHAQVGLTSSGSVAWEGSASGASLWVSKFDGAGLTDCDTEATQKLMWDTTEKRFSCGADQTGAAAGMSFADGASYFVNDTGDSMTGGLLIQSLSNGAAATIDAGLLLEVVGASSGRILHAQDKLETFGTLAASGAVRTDGDLTLNDDLSAADTVLTFGSDTLSETLKFLNAEDRFEFSDDFAATGNITASGTLTVQGNAATKADFTLNSDQGAANAVLTFGQPTTSETISFANATGRFEFSDDVFIRGAASGSSLHAEEGLTSSGKLVWETAASGASLWVSKFDGAGLTDCDTEATSKLMWDTTEKKFSCGADQTGAGGGMSFTDGASYFVNDTGDSMTGGLLIETRANGTPSTIDSGLQLEVVGTASGRVIHANDRLESSGSIVLRPSGNLQPTLYANGTSKVGILTGSPHSTLTSSGSFATAQTLMTGTGNILGTHKVIYGSGSAPITLTLPTAVGISGRQYTIKKVDTKPGNNSITIATTSSQKIDELSSWLLHTRGQEVTVISDGANWRVLDQSVYGLNGYHAKGITLNQWYSSPSNALALTTAALTTTATLRVLPFIAEKVMTIDGMAVSIQTTAASSEVRLGIYRDDGNGYPSRLVVDVGTVVTTSTGVRSICPSGCTAVSAGLPVTIQPGLYWLAINNNGVAITARGFAVGGLNPILGFPSNYTTARNVGWNIASTYAALPTGFPAAASATTAAPLPAVTVRVLY